MKTEHVNSMDDEKSHNYSKYIIFESLKHPVCIISINGLLLFNNEAFRQFYSSGEKEFSLDWEHPFFPEYRKRIAQAYIGAIKGLEKQCFAIINSSDGNQIPVEIYLFPMFENDEVSSILALLKIVDNRLLSFDRSTLSLISEDNFQYDKLHFEFSPTPILRMNQNCEIERCSHSCEGFLGYTYEEIVEKKAITYQSIFPFDFEKIKNAINNIMSGEIPFKRIGEAKISIKDANIKIANLILYPIVQNKEVSSIELVMEDISIIKELKDRINSMSRIKLLSDITKGFLHSLNNTMNVIMSKTQLLLQISEKESVVEGIQIIEESVVDIVEQTRRIQNFIATKSDVDENFTEPLVNIIEDAVEFSKMHFKVEDKENRRSINIERKYFSNENIQTNTRLLREIIISIILKVSQIINKSGTLYVNLKEDNTLHLLISVNKDKDKDKDVEPLALSPDMVNIFSGINVRDVAEKINLKIIEEESVDTYSIKAIFPKKMIMGKQDKASVDIEYKIRDLDIIIVEDEKSLVKILYELFDKMGNRVYICEDGNEALEEFKRGNYDLVITDYGISGITGIELAAKIKEINENMPTVLLSGWMLNDMTVYKNVVDLYLPKPFKLQDLLKNISKLLGEKSNN